MCDQKFVLGFSGWILGKISQEEWWNRLPWGGGIEEMHRCCTEGHCSVGVVMMGCWLDLILEVFPYLNYSVMILFPSAVVFFLCV